MSFGKEDRHEASKAAVRNRKWLGWEKHRSDALCAWHIPPMVFH